MPLTVDEGMLGHITVAEETDTEYRPLFQIYYTDAADSVEFGADVSPLVAGREAALAFAHKLVSLYNGAVEPKCTHGFVINGWCVQCGTSLGGFR